MNTKVRFVRCPRCHQVLPELAELSIYKCGGCSTILQAKTRKNDTKATEPCNRETAAPTEKNEVGHVSEDNKDSSLNHLPTLPSNEESASVLKSSGGDQNEFSDCTRNQLVGVNNSDQVPISIELSCHGNEDSSPEAYPLDSNGENEFGECSSERPKVVYSSSSELTRNEIEELSQAAGSDTEMAEDSKTRFIFRSSSPENNLDSRLKDSSVSAHRSVAVLSEDLSSHSPEQKKQTEQNGIILPSFEHFSYVDTLESVPLVKSGFELGVERREMYKSARARSYYACDGRGKEIDNKIPNRRFHYYSSGSQAGPSRLLRHHRRSQDMPEYHESDKEELLRMVHKLQNQLNRTHISKHGYSRPKFSSPQCNFLHMAVHCRHQNSCSCLQCSPRDWHCSAQPPPCGICCSGPYQSGPWSRPRQQFRGDSSRFSSWVYDTKMSDDQTRDEQEMRKRHLRPIAGGPPIIACYRCFQVLKVPSNFLLFRKRCHQLRCSACSEVLKFSLQNRIHVVRYISDDIAPPPSEVDDYADATKMKMKKSVIETYRNKNKNPVEASDFVGPSMKMSKWEESSSEIEERTPGRSSPLHRLMGYSSPSKVING